MSSTFTMSATRGRSGRPKPRRIAREQSRQPLQPTLFHKVAEWTREPTPTDRARQRRVWVAFDEGAVAFAEADDTGSYMGVWCADEFWKHFADRLNDDHVRWLTPLLARFATRQDIKQDLLREYAARHDGAEPPTAVLPLAV
ncbi:hypothetical protein [Curtobacterium sp. MCBD17_040]|uniref:hypothetical protein n=1 Tax=Curtobacterium sp. MCBD17_040 TaxID=2175674 RepID=UPI000DA7E00E|nr:hypothetical protein [Curtobacterium sp. MCBD17_040]WIB65763.1 hypothetical protein DEI94_16735 [Curtobacterium sp. MCBD17_040]